MAANIVSYEEVSAHRSPSSCWVILYGKVYDVTSFLAEHPGGSKIILQLAGTDATSEYDPVHPPGTLEEYLPGDACIGSVDQSTLPKRAEMSSAAGAVEQGKEREEQEERGVKMGSRKEKSKKEEEAAAAAVAQVASVEECLNLDEIEALATRKITSKAWAYYYSASDDMWSKRNNNDAYRKILFRPRVFVDCVSCDTSTTLLGHRFSLPIMISPAAMARLGSPDGEHGIGRAAAKFNALQIISNNASQRPEDIVAGAHPDQVFGFQLYVQNDRAKSEKLLRRIRALPNIKFIVLTLDAPVPGKRELDEREGQKLASATAAVAAAAAAAPSTSTTSQPSSLAAEADVPASGPVGLALFAGTAADLTWQTTLPWLAAHTDLPIVLKGIQTHEDAYLASRHAPQVRGMILSNHGGRALDTAPPALHTLLEIRRYCPQVLREMEVWVDGGIRRGTDVVKALCLGARGVGIGRPALFGLGAGGTRGVERVFEILKGELETAMRLLGVQRVEDLGLRHVNTRALERDIYDGPDGLSASFGDERRSKL